MRAGLSALLVILDLDGVLTAAQIDVGGVGVGQLLILPLVDDAPAVHIQAHAVVRARVEPIRAAGKA